MSRRRAAAQLLALALSAAVLTSCGGDTKDDTQDAEPPSTTASPTPSGSWKPARDPVRTDGLIWATGSTVHLGDGTTIETGTDIREYAVAGDGVYFTTDHDTDEDTDEAIAIGAHPMFEALPDGSVRPVADAAANPTASPDGRYLVFLDALGSGVRDQYGTVQVQTVIVDTTTGEETAHSTEGMGQTSSDDLTNLYEDSGIGIVGVTDDAAYVDGVGDLAFDLGTGDAEEVDSLPADARRFDDPTSPGGDWQFTLTSQRRDPLTSTEGEKVTPQTGTPRWSFDHWIDDTRAAGFAISGPGRGYQLTRRNHTELMECTVPSGRCEIVPGTRDASIQFPGDNVF